MGKFRHNDTGSIVNAWRFDGSDELAREIETTVSARHGIFTWVPKGHYDYDLHHAYGQIERRVDYRPEPILEIVTDGDWVVDVQPEHDEGSFYTIPGKKFAKLYKPVIFGEDT